MARVAGPRPRARGAPAGSEDEDAPGLQQIWLPDLDRVDRCTSCHLGIADARAARRAAALPGAPRPLAGDPPARPVRLHRVPRRAGRGHDASAARRTRPIPDWPEPMASRELMEARCGTCHKERRPKGTDWLDRGRALMADRNCVACHEVPGHDVAEVRAPRLDGLPLKVSPAWLRGWLKKPKSYLPKSRMGDFRLSERDVEALTAFLLQPRASPPLDPVDWSKADAEKGGEVFRGSRCVTCHEVNGRGGTLGPGAHPRRGQGLARVALLLDPRPAPLPAEDAHAALPLHRRAGPGPRGLPLLRVRRAARGLRGERRAAFRRARRRGPRASSRSAAATPATSSRASRRWRASARSSRRSATASWSPLPLVARGVRPTLPNWLFTKVSGPERVLEAARMPTFGFAEDEAAAVTVALLSLRAKEVPAALTTRDPVRAADVPQGEFGALVRRYRCLSCHTLGGSGHVTASGLPLSTVRARPDRLAAHPRAPGAVHREALRGARGAAGAHAAPQRRARGGAHARRPSLDGHGGRRARVDGPDRRGDRGAREGALRTDTAASPATSWGTRAATWAPSSTAAARGSSRAGRWRGSSSRSAGSRARSSPTAA